MQAVKLVGYTLAGARVYQINSFAHVKAFMANMISYGFVITAQAWCQVSKVTTLIVK